jgi:PAS domain S-box-containing protein
VNRPDTLRVLVVDDDADTRVNMRDILGMDGHKIETAGSIAEVLARPSWQGIDAVLLDRRLPDGSADELLPRLAQLAPEAAVLIVTGYSDLQGAIAALRQGAADYIVKPIVPDNLRASLLRIADRRRLALDKVRSERAFRTLVETAPCMIVILRPESAILYFNRFAEEVTGYQEAEVLGKDFFAIFLPAELRSTLAEAMRGVLSGGALRGVEHPVLCRDGTRRWVLWNAQGLPDHEGGPAVLAVGQDITALKLSQERTLQAERLAAIGQMVTGLAHESGNALARSQACLEMLALEVQDRPEALELLARVQSAQNHLQQLYDEVRNYAAPLKLERESWPLDVVWRQAWQNLAVRRQGRAAHLHEDTDGVDLFCAIDPFRLEQVFRNIFENSLAACRDPVDVHVGCDDTTLDGLPAIHVVVRDNGPGLSAEVKRRIFDPFFTTKTKGTGLGMAIARRIIEAHNGQINTGPAGPGAEIHLLLPRDLS